MTRAMGASRLRAGQSGGAFAGGGGGTGGGGSSGSWSWELKPRPVGGFGGGGATGSWSPAPKPGRLSGPAGRGVKPSPALGLLHGVSKPAAAVGSVAPEASPRTATRTVLKNGYRYQIDDLDRTTQVSGTLVLAPGQARSRAAQARAGGSDRLSTDQGGHYIARRFKGPTEAFNHFAQDANFNRGDYRALENDWGRKITQRTRVIVQMTPLYVGRSQRPASIDVLWIVNGRTERRNLSNSPRNGRYGR